MRTNALFAWLISHQPTVLFSQNKPATNNQSAVLFSQNKPAPAISHQPNEQAAGECFFSPCGLRKRADPVVSGFGVMVAKGLVINYTPVKPDKVYLRRVISLEVGGVFLDGTETDRSQCHTLTGGASSASTQATGQSHTRIPWQPGIGPPLR
jgi:hypothetical protein